LYLILHACWYCSYPTIVSSVKTQLLWSNMTCITCYLRSLISYIGIKTP
jgi:hypothetical protein